MTARLAIATQAARRTALGLRVEDIPEIAPIWRDAALELPSYDGEPRCVDTLVVGTGLTGLSTAYHVLERSPGSSVAVVDAGDIGAGASARSTGMLTPGVGQNLARLVAKLGAAKARALYLESLRAVEYVRDLAHREQIPCDLHLGGQLIVAAGPRGASRLLSTARTLESLELPCERLDAHALEDRVRLRLPPPHAGSSRALPSGPALAALRLPIAGVLHPGRLLEGLARAIVRRGGRLFGRARVVSLSRGRPVRVWLADGSVIEASSVVLATNGYAGRLAEQHGRVLPLHLRVIATEPLEASALDALGWKNREAIIDSRRLFNYFRLTDDGRIVFGGGRPRYDWGGREDERAANADSRALARALVETFRLDGPIAIAGTWSGVIGYTLDALPVLGSSRDNPAVWYAGGCCGHGIALSVSFGRWLAEQLSTGRSENAFADLRARPPLLPLELVRFFGVRVATTALQLLDSL